MTRTAYRRRDGRHHALLTALALMITSCAQSPVGARGLPPLATATWQMVLADGNALPTVVAHRALGDGRLEQSILESASLRVDATGRYEQLFRVRTVVDGVQQSNILVQDLGVWTARTDRYTLDSDTRVRAFHVQEAAQDTLRTVEAMVFRVEAGLVRGTYVRGTATAAARAHRAPSPAAPDHPLPPR